MAPQDEQQKLFVAKVLLEREVSKKVYTPFLTRNLKQALDAHERGEKRLSTDSEKRARWKLCEHMLMDSNMWTEALKAQTSVFSITSLRLRRTHGIAGNSDTRVTPAPNTSTGDGDPDWLPRVDENRLRCVITVALIHPQHQATYTVDSRAGTMILRDKNRRDVTFDIRLHEPFAIDAGKLNAAATPHDGVALPKSCHMQVTIHCHGDQRAEFLSQIEGKDHQEYSQTSDSEGIIRATWKNLPALPTAGTLLPLQRSRNNQSINLEFGVELCTSWSKKTSPFDICQKVAKLAREEAGHLAIPVSEYLEKRPQRSTVRYLFRHNFQVRSLDTQELKCIFCERKVSHSTFARLQLHYLTHHDHLEFAFSDDTNNLDLKIVQVTVNTEEGHPEPRKPGSHWQWQVPEEPFDIDSHITGDAMWTTTRSALGSSKAANPRRRQAAAASSSKRRKRKEIPPPEEVPDLPTKRIRKHRVPDVPGINFYRTTSKQTVRAGELIYDSDDDPDESWMRKCQHHRFVKLGLDNAALDFHETFNRYFSEIERPQSDRFIRDAIIRFARMYKSKLNDPAWTERFAAKLNLLETRKVIQKDVVEYCLKTVASAIETRDVTGGAENDESNETNDLFADSPPSARQARFKQLTPTKQNSAATSSESMFGRRNIAYIGKERRPPARYPIRTLLANEASKKPEYALEPSDLGWDKFRNVLHHVIGYDGETDVITCFYKGENQAINSEAEWHEALAAAHASTADPGESLSFCIFAKDVFARHVGEKRNTTTAPDPSGKKAQVEGLVTKSKRDICVCGERVMSKRKTIACQNHKCFRAFHMPCVKLEKRDPDWRCPDCVSTNTA